MKNRYCLDLTIEGKIIGSGHVRMPGASRRRAVDGNVTSTRVSLEGL